MPKSQPFACRLTLWAMTCALAGCATTRVAPSVADHQDLYSGQPRVVFGTEFPAGSAAEAAARGDQALLKQDLDRALFFYIQAVDLQPTDIASLLKIAQIHAGRQRDGLALLAYQRVLKHQPDDVVALEGAGLVLLGRRDLDSARLMLERAVALDGGRWRAHDALGVLADLRQDYAAAIGHYAAALDRCPSPAQLYNNRGYSYYLAGQLDAAVVDFQTALKLEPDFERAWRNLALVKVRQHNYHEALDAFAHVEGRAAALNDVGDPAMLEGRYQPAEEFLLEALASSPSYYRIADENLQRVRQLHEQSAGRKTF